MNPSKTQQSWLQTGTVMKRNADQEESISTGVENEEDNRAPSTNASGYVRNTSEVSTAPATINHTKQ